jgi:hypothetical protein
MRRRTTLSPSSSRSEGALAALIALLAILIATPLAAARGQGGAPPLATTDRLPDEDHPWWSGDLVEALKKSGWEPRYFNGTIRTYPDGYHLDLARKALSQPSTSITVGRTTYRTSPALVAAGREIFHTYHFGTQRFWDFRRAIDYATGIIDPAEYAKRYGVKRDREGYFVGLVGVTDERGRLAYGHACALCHTSEDERGDLVDGVPNHDYDIGLYYDALRPKVKDGGLIFLGDAGLDVLRLQGPGRTDPSMDSHWAPVKVPHLFALRAYEHGYRSNGDTSSLWLQCYRNLNGDYAVDSEIMEALMAYLLSLRAPPNPHPSGELETKGAAIFRAQGCDRCHSGEFYSSGRVIDWEVIRTDRDRIVNGYPKGYKVPSLLRVDLLKLLLHDGSLTSLEQLFDPARLSPAYEAPGIPAGRRKSGAGVPGHEFGLGLAEEDRKALVAFLRTL